MLEKQKAYRVTIKNAENTFKAVALEWHEHNHGRWSKNYSYKMLQGLEKNIFPYIGNRPINDLEAFDVLEDCLKRIEKRGSLDIAERTRQICGMVFRRAIQTGKCTTNPIHELKGAMKPHKKEHFKTINVNELPAFLKCLERNEVRLFERTRRAVYLSLYTFCRPKEIRMARWRDINFEDKLWIIPAELMKMNKDHIVPLSKQTIDILKAQKKEIEVFNTEWVFPSQIRWVNPMSDGTVNKAIKRLGFGDKMVAHGFRALARTTIAEKLKYSPEVIEKQLAHKTTNPLGEAYDRTQFIDKRKEMMQEWANYVDGLSANG